MEQLAVTAILKPKEGHEDDVRKVLQEVLDGSRNEEGCVQYDVHQSIEDTTFVIYEVWENQGAVESHINSAHYEKYRNDIGDLIISREVYKMKKLD
ncbi:putative quinol monooxygenase [Pseudalkalibacillus hwajinpoensis]|uniref:Antibiotic biosynthesis monooxygenase n=1 Tax=Guptibacillus hwajinpoensis TaxID=208199 RepID=A0A4U1MP59_9BACL|nr:putative quinol monooxygenase [Pseudalkalibacillus hwajinpoensis]TKD72452.1 antibiotic biosynthesis monooxygenase [Pseudalkalibacillus hwajinpoensis]